jgi:hypothetical protein
MARLANQLGGRISLIIIPQTRLNAPMPRQTKLSVVVKGIALTALPPY